MKLKNGSQILFKSLTPAALFSLSTCLSLRKSCCIVQWQAVLSLSQWTALWTLKGFLGICCLCRFRNFLVMMSVGITFSLISLCPFHFLPLSVSPPSLHLSSGQCVHLLYSVRALQFLSWSQSQPGESKDSPVHPGARITCPRPQQVTHRYFVNMTSLTLSIFFVFT